MSNPETWKSWEGRVVEGKFPLRQWLGGSDHSAVFLTELPGGNSQRAAIKFMEPDAPEVDRQLSRLRATAKLSHPHLIQTFEAGRCQMDATVVLYVVMEFAEEDLSQILPQRALAPAEVSDLLPPVVDALSYLHDRGFVHGRIKPSNVLAVGDQLKLSTDQVVSAAESSSARRRRDPYDAPETAAGIVSPAGDVWSVGVTLVAAMTQNVALVEASGTPGLPDTIPEPYRGIARECLHLDPKRRCSLAEIQARLQPAGRSVPAGSDVPVLSPPPANRRPTWVVALVLVVAAVIGLATLLSRGKSSSAPAPDTTPQPMAQTEPALAPAVTSPVRDPAPPPKKATASGGGGVVHQVIPQVSRNSMNTIKGTIKVNVRVDVDASGKVTTAKLKTAGPSKYFAGLALKAAQGWEFAPTQVNGQPTTSAWLVQFRFRRTSTQASSERLTR
jgi:TonB family protein